MDRELSMEKTKKVISIPLLFLFVFSLVPVLREFLRIQI